MLKDEPLSVTLESACKKLSTSFYIQDIDLSIEPGEFFCLLGPSGSGKSTLLGLIGGWVSLDKGRVLIGGVDYAGIPAYKRPVRTCFQKGGFLFPHMNVESNVGYALHRRGIDRQAIKVRVKQLLGDVGLNGFNLRMPYELSGGEAQRVAIARAIADPMPILLLDEVQAGLDRHLQASMRQLLVDLTTRMKVTTVYVTHDAAEALSLASRLSSRLGVMQSGKLLQVGRPHELYFSPSNSFLASFLGDINLLPVRAQGEGWVETIGGNRFPARLQKKISLVGIRPESISMRPRNGTSIEMKVRIDSQEFFGRGCRLIAHARGDLITVDAMHSDISTEEGREISVFIDPEHLMELER